MIAATSVDVEYRAIPGFPGYRAGSDGAVWSCWMRRSHGWRWGTKPVMGEHWRMLKPHQNKKGYLSYTLVADGRKRLVGGHILVLEAFVGPRPDGMEACHGLGGSSDNRIGNLRWDTKSENERDKVRHGTTAKGEMNSRAKVTSADVLAIRRRAADGETHRSISQDYPLSPDGVRSIVNRSNWRHI
jgi:hypothetical protein